MKEIRKEGKTEREGKGKRERWIGKNQLEELTWELKKKKKIS